MKDVLLIVSNMYQYLEPFKQILSRIINVE